MAVLSAQVDDLTKTLVAAQNTASSSTDSLGELTDRAEGVAKRLELLVASMHDLPESQPAPTSPAPQMQTTAQAPPEDPSPAGPVFKRHSDAA